MMLIRSKWNLCNNFHVYGALLYSSEALQSSSQVNSLYRRLSRAGDPRISMTDLLDQWVGEGRDVKVFELQRFIRYLRNFGRHKHALQVSEWMSKERKHGLSPGDIAVQLDLISKVYGLEQVKRYFTAIPETKREFKVYAALLSCYAEHKSLEEAESIMQKIKQYGYVILPLPYNVMLSLYAQMGMYEKLDSLMHEMKEKNICNSYTYMIRLKAFADIPDIKGMEKFLEQMETEPMVTVGYHTYTCAAKGYLQGGQVEKAMAMLKKSESSIRGNERRLAYECLLTMYAAIGKKDEMYRVWNIYKNIAKFPNSGYVCMFRSLLLKLDDIDGAERLLEEWESAITTFDCRIPNLMITAYCKNGMLEKAESYIKRLLESGRELRGDTWDRLAHGYCSHNDMEKAVEMMKKAISKHHPGWRPDSFVFAACIEHTKEKGDSELALEILRLSREQGHFSDATYDKLFSYVHSENPDTKAFDLMQGNHLLGRRDQVPDGEEQRESELKEVDNY